jgi:RNA polymerase sigma-70 factor (ECF subfamily)
LNEDLPDSQPPSGGGSLAGLSSVALLARARGGDGAARETLMRRYWPRLARWAHGRLPSRARGLHDTADLVQDTLLAALHRLDDFEPQHDGAVAAYLRVAILNHIRRLATRARPQGVPIESGSGLVDAGPSPLEEVIGREALDRYERALARLRPDDREAVQLKVELGLPYSEIAGELGKPTITAARMAVSRALCRLALEMRRHA